MLKLSTICILLITFLLPCSSLTFAGTLKNLATTGLADTPDTANIDSYDLNEKPIDVFNHGEHTRDFTYIDDIVEGIIKTLDNTATSNIDWKSNKPDPASSNAPWRIFNIGNSKPVKLMDYISALEKALGKKAKINFLPLQLGDVPDTYANVDNLKEKFDYKPSTSVVDGVSNFVRWYKEYYKR